MYSFSFSRRAYKLYAVIALSLISVSSSLLLEALALPEKALADKTCPTAATTEVKPVEPPTPEQAALEAYNTGVRLFRAAQQESSRGELYNQSQLLKEAEACFKKALKLNPKLVEAPSNLGFLYLSQNKNKKAEAAFEQALVLDPKHSVSLNGLATVAALSNNFPKALSTLDALLSSNPTQAQLWFNKGSVLQKFGQWQAAEAAYTKAIELDSTHQASLFNLATLYDNTNQPVLAKRYYELTKHVAIDTPIGLEALRRLEILNTVQPKTNP
jgi:tetratricopeptide (TPR) repeat protein